MRLYGRIVPKIKAFFQGTIGNLGDFEDVIGDATGGSVIMAIKIGHGEDVGVVFVFILLQSFVIPLVFQNKVSISFLDLLDFRVLTSEFIDSPLFAQVEV